MISKYLLPLLISAFVSAREQNHQQQIQLRPKVFIKNEGQVVDQNNMPNQAVKFIYHDGAINLELKASGFSYEIFHVSKSQDGFSESTGMDDKDASDYLDKLDIRVTSQRIDVTFPGANKKVLPQASNPIEGYFNYIHAPVATRQHLRVQGFQKITYPNLYDGIDLVFYAPIENFNSLPFSSGEDARRTDEENSEDELLHYEFIVHPGADLSGIKFLYCGATDFALLETGDILLNTSYGFIRETKPKYFIEGKKGEIAGSFLLHKNEKSFSAYDYDHSKFLIIDPNIIWGTYYGGELADEIAEVVVDSKGEPTIDGNTISLAHIASGGAYQASFGGGVYDFFIAHFKSNGKLKWATYFGGNEKEDCYGLGIDHNDHPIAVGNSLSEGLATPGAYKTLLTNSTSSDIVIAKFDTDGLLMWCTYYGGESPENARNCVCDSKGKIYLSGTTSSTTGIAYGNAFQPVWGGTDDTWLAKFTKDGQPIWSTYYGDSGVDRAHVVNLDKKGNLFVGGTCSSRKGIATPDAFHTTYGGGTSDAYIAKFDTAGNFIWGTYVGGADYDRVRGVECDSAGNAYLGGFTVSDTGIATPGSYQPFISPPQSGAQTEDAFLIKFNTNGARKWGTYYGGTADEQMWGMSSDKKIHAVYIMGSTASPEDIASGSTLQSEKSGGQDGFLARFRENGSVQWSSYFGGKSGDQFEDAMPDTSGFLYVAGRNTASTMPATSGVYQTTYYGGASDAMLYKFYIGSDCFDQFEPNETASGAYLMKSVAPSDTTIYGWNGSIRNANDHDWFKVKVKAPNNNLRIILQDMPENYNLRLYSSDGSLLYQSLHTDLIPDTITANNLVVGTYKFKIHHAANVFDSLGCYHVRMYSSIFPFQKSSEMEEQVPPEKLAVFPNPAKNEISFSLYNGHVQKASMNIYDLLGREVYAGELPLQEGHQDITLPIGRLSSGAFEIVIMADDHALNGKFIKE
ncbi:MAG: T9SS type A sorting domain-containing protein [Chitinophagales bacterium]